MKKPTISVIGLGFVGLTLAATNAKLGFRTIGIDNDYSKLSILKKEQAPFFEPKLNQFLKTSLKNQSIEFSKDYKKILDSDITFITVGTPPKNDGNIDLKYVISVSKIISKILKEKKKKHLIVIKSTVLPTTTMTKIIPLFKKKNIDVVVNPEFLRESRAIDDLLKPHLIVIGQQNKKSGIKLMSYYKQFYKKMPEVLETDPTTAELIKYSNNAFLATKISFINSIANICERLPNTDVKTVAYAIGKDPRIGSLFLNAGPGFGGSCLPKDLSALIQFSNKFGKVNDLLRSVKKINEFQPTIILKMMENVGILKKMNKISILGLSFKKDTDDVRFSVAISLTRQLLKKGIKINVHDPMAIDNFKAIFKNKVEYQPTIKQCLKDSVGCIILTDWDEYKNIKQSDFIKNMKIPNVIDTRRVLNPKKYEKIYYKSIGLGNSKKTNSN